MIQREKDDRGYRYRIQMSGWTAPKDVECKTRPKNRGQYIRRSRKQLDFRFVCNELKETLTRLNFEAFFSGALETPDGKPIPCGGGSSAGKSPSVPYGGGIIDHRDQASIPHGGVKSGPDGGDPVGRSPMAGDSEALKRLNVIGSNTFNVERFKRKASKDDENYIMGELRAIMPKTEMSGSGAWWRINVRYWPEEMRRAVGELKARVHTDDPANRGAWLTDEIRRYVGEPEYEAWRTSQVWKNRSAPAD